MGKLVYDGKSVYEIDEDCLRKKEEREHAKRPLKQAIGSMRKIALANKKKK